jgi:hypothetical protein
MRVAGAPPKARPSTPSERTNAARDATAGAVSAAQLGAAGGDAARTRLRQLALQRPPAAVVQAIDEALGLAEQARDLVCRRPTT